MNKLAVYNESKDRLLVRLIDAPDGVIEVCIVDENGFVQASICDISLA